MRRRGVLGGGGGGIGKVGDKNSRALLGPRCPVLTQALLNGSHDDDLHHACGVSACRCM